MTAHDAGEQDRTADLITSNEELQRQIEGRSRAEERFTKAFHSNPSPMAISTQDGHFLEVNQAFLRVLGFESHEVIGRKSSDLELFPDAQRFLAARVILYEQGSLKDYALDVRTKSGRVRHGLFSGEIIQLRDRQVLLTVMHDITERKQAEDALQRQHRTLKRLLEASDRERQLIAYEIHDELAQQLAGAIMQFQTYEGLKGQNPELAAKAFAAGMTMLQQSHYETRRLIAGVRPPILDEMGVVEAIAHLVNEQSRFGRPAIEYRAKTRFDRLSPTLENAVYRIVQEALANACQHSQSSSVRVSLAQRGEQLRIEIRDWGAGFDPQAIQENRFGLEGIRERARILGGKCRISSQLGQGTQIVVQLPVVLREQGE